MHTGSAVRPPAYQLLADELRAKIGSGRLRPGQRLPAEPELCLRTGLSRSTVREALRLLASQHLIVTTRGVTGGSFVAQPNPGKLSQALSTPIALLRTSAVVDIGHLIDVRRALEVPAARLAARWRTDDQLAAMRAALFDPAASTPGHMVSAHCDFHVAVAVATGNALFELLTRPLYQLSNADELDWAAPPGYWSRIDADHRELLRCLDDGDENGAAEISDRHLDFVAASFDDIA